MTSSSRAQCPVANLTAYWCSSQVEPIDQPVILQLMRENEHLEVENRDAQDRIAALMQQLEEVQVTKEKLAKVERDLANLLATTEQRLEKVQETDAECGIQCQQKLAQMTKLYRQQIVNLETLRQADRKEIEKLKNRFNKRKVAAEIAELEQQVAALNVEKAICNQNRLITVQTYVQKTNNSINYYAKCNQ